MKIISVEDDPIQAELIKTTLTQAGYEVQQFSSGKACLSTITKSTPCDLFLLDWELPDIIGIDLLTWIRNNLGPHVPVIFLTSRSDEKDLLQAFELGADDYINKPFIPSILVARVTANLRRNVLSKQNAATETIVGPYRFDNANRKAYLNDELITLAPKEFDLASLFFRNIGRLFSRDTISTTIWNREIPATSRTIDTHLSNIRHKLKIQPANGVQITASYALGYRLELVQE